MIEERSLKISLLSAGKDPHYALGLLGELVSRNISVEFVGNDEMQKAEVTRIPGVVYFNLRGDQSDDAPMLEKVLRVVRYYIKLIWYAFRTDSSLFHILWLNKFILFDRMVLNYYYKMLGKKVVFTAHNINAGERDGKDTFLNRLSLKMMYGNADHIFVHTKKMGEQLVRDYGIKEEKVTIIPFGINNMIPKSDLSREEARKILGLNRHEKTILFFGFIAPYKGLDCLVLALKELKNIYSDLRLLVVGQIKDCEEYWEGVQELIKKNELQDLVIKRIEYIPDREVEVYYKSADAVILPYRFIFQSGVLFLAYIFGLPVIATDVGSMREDIIEGETGFICRPDDPSDLAEKIRLFFQSDLYRDLERRRASIIAYAREKHSWGKVGERTIGVYKDVLGSG